MIKLKNEFAKKIYNNIKDLPILDYHCHLCPKAIYEDKPFESLANMWLDADHYKWRLMRAAGVAEEFITGEANVKEKFWEFLTVLSTAFGNPLKDWAERELKQFFNIDLPLLPENAGKILKQADDLIKNEALSPRKLIKKANVEYIGTTDDPTDTLKYHKLLAEDKTFKTRVTPTFRVDKLFKITSPDFLEYLAKLEGASGMEITSLTTYLTAIDKRMKFFKEAGCSFADIGIEDFPSCKKNPNRAKAEKAFDAILKNDGGVMFFDDENLLEHFLNFLYIYWLSKCKEYGFTAQLHLNVLRNSNTAEFKNTGADSGYDIVGDKFILNNLRGVLDNLNSNNGLPNIIIYTLNPNDYYPLLGLCGSFKGVNLGVPWWHNDHEAGIMSYFERVSELSHISSVLGMLTDSRSFLSYSRHDYFRIILANFLSRFDEKSEEERVIGAAKAISYCNMKKLLGDAL